MMKPCLDCGTPSNATRCPTHTTRHSRATNRTAQINRASKGGRPYDNAAYRFQGGLVRATATVCHLCGEGPKPNDPWQADHIIPVFQGGGVGPLAAAHRSCNIGRANRLRAGKPDPANHATKRRGHPTHPTTPPPTTNDPQHHLD